jgi:hypothetical protein
VVVVAPDLDFIFFDLCFFCYFLISFFFLLFSIWTMLTRFSWPLLTAIDQALAKSLSQIFSCSAKVRMAPKAGPFGHFELSQSPVELPSSFSPTQH